MIEHFNGRGKTAEALIPRVIASQSPVVDEVSGAAYSSEAILKAIESALEKGLSPQSPFAQGLRANGSEFRLLLK